MTIWSTFRAASRPREEPTTSCSASTRRSWQGLSFGVAGAVGGTYNFAAPLYERIMRAFEKGDLTAARSAQLRATEMIKVLSAAGFTAASKAVMAFVGVDCGPVRPPLHNLSREQLRSLYDKLAPLETFAQTDQSSVSALRLTPQAQSA